MLGWSITVTGATPEEYHDDLKTEPVLAEWQADVMGTRWIDTLVEKGDATQVRFGGYPDIYTAKALVMKALLSGEVPPPGDTPIGHRGGLAMIHHDRLLACPNDLMLTIVVWDQS